MKHSPQEMLNGITTRSPGRTCVTSAPASSTMPIGSWPRMSPSERHGFPPDFASVEPAGQLIDAWLAHPDVWGVVAQRDGRVIGSNFLEIRTPVAGVGPITVD